MIFYQPKLETKTCITHHYCYWTNNESFFARSRDGWDAKSLFWSAKILDIEVIWGSTITEIPIAGIAFGETG